MILGIDIGSHKIAALIGEGLPGGGLRVLGAGHAPAEGIRAGEVIHVEDAAGAIAAAIDRAERLAGTTFDEATVGVTGMHLASRNHAATVPCGRRPRPIGEEDVQRVLESAGTVPTAQEREILHVLAKRFRVDDGPSVETPAGMEGYELSTDVHIVTGSHAAFNNLRRCLNMADVSPSRLVMSTLAAGETTLSGDERELGVVVVDIGHAVTCVACYRDGALEHSAVIGIGGRHMTNDIAVCFQTPFEQAERIKQTHGHALPEHDDDRSMVDVVPFGEEDPQRVPRTRVSEVLAARVDELADLIGTEISEAGYADGPSAGVVLCGGGTELKGLPRRVHERWGLPVRVGRPRDVLGLAQAVSGPDHAGAVGLLAWAARDVRDAALLPGTGTRSEGGVGWGTVIDWMRDALLPRRNGR